MLQAYLGEPTRPDGTAGRHRHPKSRPDVYLQIDGIKGASADDKYKDGIEFESANWSITQSRSATASTGGGHTAERAELSEITFHKLADLASPILAQNCAAGNTIGKAKFVFLRADGQRERIPYFEIALDNVLIGQVAPSVGAGSIMSERIALKFSKCNWKYTQQKVTGGAGGNTQGRLGLCHQQDRMMRWALTLLERSKFPEMSPVPAASLNDRSMIVQPAPEMRPPVPGDFAVIIFSCMPAHIAVMSAWDMPMPPEEAASAPGSVFCWAWLDPQPATLPSNRAAASTRVGDDDIDCLVCSCH